MKFKYSAIFLLSLILFNFSQANSWNKKMESKENLKTTSISGISLSYFLLAHHEFSKEQKNLHDFIVEISDEGDIIDVTFIPNRAENERRILGGRTSLGRSVTYKMSKLENKIIKWNYHK